MRSNRAIPLIARRPAIFALSMVSANISRSAANPAHIAAACVYTTEGARLLRRGKIQWQTLIRRQWTIW
jgi:hypothetical protein